QRLDDSERRRLCPAPEAVPQPLLQPVIRLVGPVTASGADPAAQPFTLVAMSGAAAALAGDVAAGTAAVATIARWAKADALSDLVEVGPDRNNANTIYSLKRVLLGLIPAWAVLRARTPPEPALGAAIEAWLDRRVSDADQPTGPASGRATEVTQGNRNHQRLMREAVVMAYGALIGDADKFRRGGQAFLGALREMRPDGSLPLETARGARALWYQRHAVASLVFIAELARAQGYDLYGADLEGRKLARGVDFLLTEISEPRRLASYAPERQDLGFLDTRPSGRNLMAWLEAWHRRSPPGALATGDLVATQLARRPLIDEISGGNLTCFFAKIG
ncbi:MAG: alginate lyase family protein, partial [Alphaproteobacteria bacterium]|nr:alginate lyase family protein [Alphaproteobacteria bacterium]